MEMRAHSLAASLMCWAAGPQFLGYNTPLIDLKSGNITGPVASGSAYLMEGIWLWLERYLNIKYIHWSE